MDSRLQLSKALGQAAEKSFILRNGGGRVTEDVLRGLVLCSRLMQVTEIGIIHHTDCRLQRFTNEELVQRTGVDIDFKAFSDPITSILEDINQLIDCEMLGPGLRVWGALYHIKDHTVRIISDVFSPERHIDLADNQLDLLAGRNRNNGLATGYSLLQQEGCNAER